MRRSASISAYSLPVILTLTWLFGDGRLLENRLLDLILNPFGGFDVSYEQQKPRMIHDFRFAFRQLIKAPGFTFAAVLVLALGIGANTAVFSLVNTLFFAPPAYAKPHEMVQLFSQDKKDPKKFRGFSYPTYPLNRTNTMRSLPCLRQSNTRDQSPRR